MTRDHRSLRRRGGIVAAFVAAGVGFLPEDVEIAAWLFLTLVTVIVAGAQWIEAHRAVLAARRSEALPHENVETAARRIGALCRTTENLRASEAYRFLAALALLTVGLAAVFQIPSLIAPALFFVASLILLNSLIAGIERSEIRRALDAETGGRRASDE